MKKIISVITPCFNEEDSVIECISALRKIFKDLPNYQLEHIFCDNCSSDKTVSILRVQAALDSSIKVIINSRNFGILKNTYNGVMASKGDAVVLFMPVDLQDPPELIPKFLNLWEKGYEIVYGIRAQRKEGFWLRITRKLYYRILSNLSYIEYPPDAGDFQLVDRKVVDAMKRVHDMQPFLRMMTFDTGFRAIGVPYTWRLRRHGVSKNRLFQMLEQGLNGIISFSNIPIRTALILGIFTSLTSILYAFYVLVITLFGDIKSVAGIPTIIVALFFFGGVQLFFLGVLGEYILAIYSQVKTKPLVVERERINFE